MKRWVKDERGQSLLEFALLMPLLFILVCGIIDFGRLMYAYMHLNMAAQEAVRLGGLGKTDAQITSFVKNYVHISGTETRITISPSPANRESGDYITVKLQHPLPYITPVISAILPDPVVTADSTIRIE